MEITRRVPVRTVTAHLVYCGGPIDGRIDVAQARPGPLPLRITAGWPGDDGDASGVYELARLEDALGYYDWSPRPRDARATRLREAVASADDR